MKSYDEIININYPFKLKHTRMTIENRASIFSPFSALSGYEESIIDASKEIINKVELDDNQKEIVNDKLIKLEKSNFKDEIEIKYYNQNSMEYLNIKDKIKKIDMINKEILLLDKAKIKIDDILDINVFNN